MNALEYIFKGAEKCIVYYDEAGNMYVEHAAALPNAVLNFIDYFTIPLGYDMGLVEAGVCDMLRQYEVIGDDTEYSNTRRPYYRMRGRPVTQEQAFDIIRRTDHFVGGISEICKHDDFVGCLNFDNWILQKNHYPRGHGWIHTDGTVGANAITQTFPSVDEFIMEWLYKLIKFPYLDLVIAVTWWNEVSPATYDYDWIDPFRRGRLWERPEYDADFYEAVVLGIHVHDKTVEILSAVEAVKVYRKYADLYGKNWEMYVSEYYEKNGIEQADLGYLKRCIEAYGLDADAVLGKVPEYTWKGKT